MLACRNPYVRAPNGIDRKAFLYSREARTAITPFGCGNCLPCRILKSREKFIRIMLEADCHEDSCFLTLTYKDERCPRDDHGTGILQPYDFTSFLWRLRKSFKEFRYFGVGEYGNYPNYRPHYHILLFGIPYNKATYEIISKKWTDGFIYLGELNQTTARYCVGYCIKKLTKKGDELLYGKPPEFCRSSKGTKANRLGGIGRPACRKIASSINKYPARKTRVVREICYGKGTYPLGRYLTKALSDDLGIPESSREFDLQDQQIRLYAEFGDAKNYYQSILESTEGKSNSIEWKETNYKLKRRI